VCRILLLFWPLSICIEPRKNQVGKPRANWQQQRIWHPIFGSQVVAPPRPPSAAHLPLPFRPQGRPVTNWTNSKRTSPCHEKDEDSRGGKKEARKNQNKPLISNNPNRYPTKILNQRTNYKQKFWDTNIIIKYNCAMGL